VADPANEIKAAILGAATTVSSAGEDILASMQKTLKDWLQFNKQACARAMLSGKAGPYAQEQYQALDHITRAEYTKNYSLKNQHNQNNKPEDDQSNTPRP